MVTLFQKCTRWIPGTALSAHSACHRGGWQINKGEIKTNISGISERCKHFNGPQLLLSLLIVDCCKIRPYIIA